MFKSHSCVMAAVFFCTCGWVYTTSAIGDEAAAPVPVAAETAPAGDPDALPQGQTVKVGSFGQIDLHVKNLDLTQVLQLLSIQSQRNIVASRSVSGSISADLYGVDFYEALDAILHTNGFGYREKGNFIYVYTADEIRAMELEERRPVTRLVRLNYITAADATVFISPLASPIGSIAISGSVGASMMPSVTDAGANSFAHADTLILRDYAENVDEMVALLQELDIRPKQVLVEATVMEAKLSENNSWGVDLTILADFAMKEFTSPLGVIDDLISGAVGPSGQAIETNLGGTLGKAGSTARIGIVTNNVAAFIQALDSVTDTTMLANPKLLVLNRQRADLLVGDRFGYLSTTATDTSTTQTVEFLDTGTQLTVRPFVSDDGFIRLELKPSISSGGTSLLGGFVIPNQRTQELTTNVMVRSGQTVMLGGLFKEEITIDRNQVPGLGDIPLLGAAFKGKDDNVERSEVIFLITPTIVKDEALYLASDRMKDSMELARIGTRQGLLPWSRTKLTSSHLRDAMDRLDAGDVDRALWSVNMALTLDPSFVEARRFKEQITGQRMYLPQRSILHDAIDELVIDRMGGQKADDSVSAVEVTE
jgi:type IV pilus assembly protein PilQ